MTVPELFPEAGLCTFLGLVDKGGCAAPVWSVNSCGKRFYLWRQDTKAGGLSGAQSSCPLHHLPSVRGGSDLLQGRGELGRAGTFSECSQREPGLPTNAISQILLSLGEAC